MNAAEPLWVRTSGSTGRAKDVALSVAAVTASARATLARLGGPGQWVLALPAQYVAGLQVIVRSVLANTSPVLLEQFPDLTCAARHLTGTGPYYLAIVPTQLQRWLDRDDQIAALQGFDAVLVGGAAASTRLVDRARELGINVVTTYGMSETSGGCVYDGVALDGVTVAIGPGGRIRVAGSTLFDGYVGRDDLTAAVLRDGWLRTPDLGRLDPDGRLVVLGRADDVVISGGVNIAGSRVEARIAEMPGVRECVVAGVPDAEWGARVVAYLAVPPDGVAPDLPAVRDFVAQILPRTWAPREIVVVDELPLRRNGKIDRQRLVTRSLDG